MGPEPCPVIYRYAVANLVVARGLLDRKILEEHLYGSAYLQSMDFQREPQSKYHLYFLDCFFFTSWPTRPISLTLTQTPTPADRVVSIHSWRPLGHSTVWADFVCVSLEVKIHGSGLVSPVYSIDVWTVILSESLWTANR